MGDYKPEYAKGEILVCFLGNIQANTGFVSTITELIGYRLKDEDYDFGDSYIIQTEPGSEDKACEEFKTLSINGQLLVDWAARRDMKWEKRSRDLDELVDLAQSLNDDCDQGDADYNKSLDKIIDYASSLKEKKE